MDMRIMRESVEMEKILRVAQAQTAVEGEVALPGGLREEAHVLYADAVAVMGGGELTGNRVTADGRVIFHVLYTQGDPEIIRAIETTADFNQAMPLLQENEKAQGTALVMPRGVVEHVSAKTFNGRMILKALVRVAADVLAPAAVSVVTGVQDVPGVQGKSQQFSLQRTVGRGDAQALMREEIELADVLQITDSLFATAKAQVTDITGGDGGRATVSGEVKLEAWHSAGMPGRPLLCTRHTLPFEQRVELSGGLGDLLAAQAQVRDVAVMSQDAGDGGRIMRAEIVLDVRVEAMGEERVTVLADAYTTQGEELKLTTQPVSFRAQMRRTQAAESGKATLMLPEGEARMRTVLAAFARPVVAAAARAGERLTVEGVLETTVIYLTDDDKRPLVFTQEEPFELAFATEAEPEDAITLTPTDIDAVALTGDRAEMKYVMQLDAQGLRAARASVITDVSPVEPREAERGIALYYAQPGETLWDIARRYRMAVEDVRRFNPKAAELPQDAPVAQGTVLMVYNK